MTDKRKWVAALFTALGIAELALLNFLFCPGYIWFHYAAYAALWWPLAVFVPPGRRPVGFALIGSAMTAVFLAAVNMQVTPRDPWFLWAIYPLVWWPVSVYFSGRRKFKWLSLAGCAVTVAYFTVLNLMRSPGHLWFLYVCWPFLVWPVATYLGKKAGTLWFAAVCGALTIAYYTALNVFVSPGFPWAICPAFAVIWWPMSIYFARKRQWVGYSLAGSALTVAFLFALNLAASPTYLWAFYPTFAVLWWPLSVACARRKAWLTYSIAGTALLSAFFIALNWTASPGAVWAIYPVFAALWWPMSVLFARLKNWLGYSIAATALTSAFFIAVNLVTSPGTPWAFYPIFALLWWPMSMFFARRKSGLGYSIAATVLTSAFLLAVNLLYSPGVLWVVFPVFALLWWPMSMVFARRKNGFGFSVAGTLLASALLLAVNLMFSPGVIWAVYPIFALLWWPLSLYFFKYRKMKAAE